MQEKSVEVAQDESESLDMLCATASWLRSNFKDHLVKAGFLSILNLSYELSLRACKKEVS